MKYNELSAVQKAQIANICRKNDITRPEDIEKAYNNYVEGKSIFDGLSEGYQRASAFGKFLANGGHIYDGDTEPTQQMDSRPAFPWIEMARQEEQAYQNAMQEPYFQVNGKISKDEWRERNKPRDPGQITQSKYPSGPVGLGQMIDEYVREAKYRANNGELMLQGKYGLPLAGLAAGAGAAAGSVLPTILANPYVDAGLISMGGAHAAQSIANGEADWMTALELAPMVRPAKAVYQTAKPFVGPIVDAVAENAGKARTFLGSPRTGKWTQFGDDMYRLESGNLGMNQFVPHAESFSDRLAKGKVKLEELEARMGKSDAKKLLSLGTKRDWELTSSEISLRNELKRKFMLNAKGKSGTSKGITATKAATKRNEQIGNPAAVAESLYKDLMGSNEAGILKGLEEKAIIDYGAPVKWNWFDQGILTRSNIPPQLAVSKALIDGVEDTEPIMRRFLQNFSDKDGIIQKTFGNLVKNGIIRVNDRAKVWVDAEGHRIDPTRFTLNYILQNELKSTNKIDYKDLFDGVGWRSQIPYHGTRLSTDIVPTFNTPGETRSLFTTIDDGSPGFANVKTAYGTGASLPVMRKTGIYEVSEPLKATGLSHNSNNYGEVGELADYAVGITKNGIKPPIGKAQVVLDVSDVANIPNNTGARQNEYIFTKGTPDIKFLFNTWNLKGQKGAFTNAKGGRLYKRK